MTICYDCRKKYGLVPKDPNRQGTMWVGYCHYCKKTEADGCCDDRHFREMIEDELPWAKGEPSV